MTESLLVLCGFFFSRSNVDGGKTVPKIGNFKNFSCLTEFAERWKLHDKLTDHRLHRVPRVTEVIIRVFSVKTAAAVGPMGHPCRCHAGGIPKGLSVRWQLVALSRICRRIVSVIRLTTICWGSIWCECPGGGVVIRRRWTTMGCRWWRVL